MWLDWIAREGWMIVSWWLIATLAGLAALPLCLRLLGNLPDKGYTFARAAGILLIGFVYWLLNTFGLLQNNAGGIVLAGLIVALVGVAAYFQAGRPSEARTPLALPAFWRENRALVITAELLFIALLVAWATVRAYQNNLNGTEKPMDLAFLSAAMHSPAYPPADPWLSGFAISYYYFGYVLGGMFATLSGAASTMAYNLWTAMLFALTGLTAFGVVANLVRARFVDAPARGVAPGILTGLFGVVLLLLAGNYQAAFVEVPYQTRTATADYLQFWDVNVRQTPLAPFAPCPEGQDCPRDWGIDYFRAARTLNDRNLPSMVAGGADERVEVINEFPMFSFLLADNHPHVMALPFTLLALGLAVNTLLGAAPPNREQIALYGICLGGLIFLNTWDSPVYISVLVGANLLRVLLARGRLTLDDWLASFVLMFGLLAISVAAYFPFLVSFSSQLGGALPNLIHPTPVQQYFLAFGPVLPIALIYALVEAWRGLRDRQFNWSLGVQSAVGLILLLIAALGVFVLVGSLNPDARNEALRFVESAGGWSAFLPEVLAKRATHIVTTLLLALLVLLTAGRVLFRPRDASANETPRPYPPSTGFALLLIAAAAALTLAPDYIYLRDNFAHRMNTVFKFYYIGWTLYAVAGAYGVYSLFADARQRLPARPIRLALAPLVVIALALGLVYTALGIQARTGREATIITVADERGALDSFVTLDGWRSIVTPDDYAVITCLRDYVERAGEGQPVALEAASDGSYDFFLQSSPLGSGRVSGLSGLPTVLGWQGHQAQWRGRGFSAAVGSRLGDVRRIYESLQFDQVGELLAQYEVDYIVYGAVERERYGAAGEQKFLEAYELVCESGSSRVFRAREGIALAESPR